jgi:predicted TIM-barrel fold metal-dependent hydrolase
MGAYIEHSLCMFLEGCKFKSCNEGLLKDYIEAAGVDRTILCSDLGQVGVFHPIEGIRRGIRLCIEFGYSDEDIRKMVSNNAAKMLGIEEDLPERAVA